MKTTPLSTNSQINFTSGITLLNEGAFYKRVRKFPVNSRVDFPCTAKEIIINKQGYTLGVKSCTAGGILVKNPIDNAIQVLMFHLAPKSERIANAEFKTIKKAFLEKLKGFEPIQGLLLGSKGCKPDVYPTSVEMFDNVEGFFKELGIPYSKFKGLPHDGGAHIAYTSKTNHWLICTATDKCNKAQFLKHFDEIVLSSKDHFSKEKTPKELPFYLENRQKPKVSKLTQWPCR